MTTIYGVSSGEYSDYHIDAMFSTKEAADEFVIEADKTGGSHWVEEWILDERAGARAAMLYGSEIDVMTGALEDQNPFVALDSSNLNGPVDVHDLKGEKITLKTIIRHSFKSQDYARKLAFEARQEALRLVGGIDRLEPAWDIWLKIKAPATPEGTR